jgi:hypothetical protein
VRCAHPARTATAAAQAMPPPARPTAKATFNLPRRILVFFAEDEFVADCCCSLIVLVQSVGRSVAALTASSDRVGRGSSTKM